MIHVSDKYSRHGFVLNLQVMRRLLFLVCLHLNISQVSTNIQLVRTSAFSSSFVKCAIVDPSDMSCVSFSTRSRLQCAFMCLGGSGCVGFNYLGFNSPNCNLFTTTPTYFEDQDGCNFYQVTQCDLRFC